MITLSSEEYSDVVFATAFNRRRDRKKGNAIRNIGMCGLGKGKTSGSLITPPYFANMNEGLQNDEAERNEVDSKGDSRMLSKRKERPSSSDKLTSLDGLQQQGTQRWRNSECSANQTLLGPLSSLVEPLSFLFSDDLPPSASVVARDTIQSNRIAAAGQNGEYSKSSAFHAWVPGENATESTDSLGQAIAERQISLEQKANDVPSENGQMSSVPTVVHLQPGDHESLIGQLLASQDDADWLASDSDASADSAELKALSKLAERAGNLLEECRKFRADNFGKGR